MAAEEDGGEINMIDERKQIQQTEVQGDITKKQEDCLSCRVIGTTFLFTAGGYVYYQGCHWKTKGARMLSFATSLGFIFLGILRAVK